MEEGAPEVAGIGIVKKNQTTRCFTDHRSQNRIEHSVEQLLRHRVFALELGYGDVNDHGTPRRDWVLIPVH